MLEKIDLKKSYKICDSADYIYISHIHPDHASKKTLKKISKEKKFLIHKYASPFLKRNLNILGFKNIIEVENNINLNLSKETSVKIFAADDCNPEICKKFLGCNYETSEIGKRSQQIDSALVIKNNNNTLVNLNDCVYDMTKSVLKKIIKIYKKVNICLVGYNAASEYPQTFKNLNYKQKINECKKIKKQFLEYTKKFVNDLNVDYFIPFAGEFYLSGRFHKLNKYTPTTSRNECYNYFNKSELKNKFIMLNYDKTFDLDKPQSNYKSLTKNYLTERKRKLSKIKYVYDDTKKPTHIEIEDLLIKSFDRVSFRQKLFNLRSNTQLSIKYFNKFFNIDFSKEDAKFSIENKKPKKNYLSISCDERLLKRILLGPKYAHWNNASLGSHISFDREPNKFDRNVHGLLNYLHS